jgi:hypothetical protein
LECQISNIFKQKLLKNIYNLFIVRFRGNFEFLVSNIIQKDWW